MSDDAKATAPDSSKDTVRRAAFVARKAAHADAALATVEATAHLLAAIGPPLGKTIAGYMPMRTEIDVLPALHALHAEGASLCVPVIDAPATPLRFRQWHPDCVMEDGAFGARIPADGPFLTPDIVIVPLVGFDLSLHRLGYGGGFYDRTLEKLRANGALRTLGFAYAGQQLPHIPHEATDEPLDLIVTEQGTLAAPRAEA